MTTTNTNADTSIRPDDLSPINPQTQSPLFSRIPAEIRNDIFSLALQEYDDPKHMYARATYWTRPGFLGRKRVDTELLRTCKRVYEETKAVPLRELEIVYFAGKLSRVPHEYRRRYRRNHVLCQLPRNDVFHPDQWSKIQHVHFFPQLFAFDDIGTVFHGAGPAQYLAPKLVTITIRYTDWWYWENNHALYLDRPNTRAFSLPNSVEKLVMELETREGKVKELEQVVEGIFEKKEKHAFKRRDGKMLVPRKDYGVKEWKWEGPTTFGDEQRYKHHPDGESMVYVVKVLTWRVDGRDDDVDEVVQSAVDESEEGGKAQLFE